MAVSQAVGLIKLTEMPFDPRREFQTGTYTGSVSRIELKKWKDWSKFEPLRLRCQPLNRCSTQLRELLQSSVLKFGQTLVTKSVFRCITQREGHWPDVENCEECAMGVG